MLWKHNIISFIFSLLFPLFCPSILSPFLKKGSNLFIYLHHHFFLKLSLSQSLVLRSKSKLIWGWMKCCFFMFVWRPGFPPPSSSALYPVSVSRAFCCCFCLKSKTIGATCGSSGGRRPGMLLQRGHLGSSGVWPVVLMALGRCQKTLCCHPCLLQRLWGGMVGSTSDIRFINLKYNAPFYLFILFGCRSNLSQSNWSLRNCEKDVLALVFLLFCFIISRSGMKLGVSDFMVPHQLWASEMSAGALRRGSGAALAASRWFTFLILQQRTGWKFTPPPNKRQIVLCRFWPF